MRASGILMPVFSLPGPFGIGTLGAEAFAFVDFLARARQTYWQILPIGPTGYGDSPYQSFSAFAGIPTSSTTGCWPKTAGSPPDEIPRSGAGRHRGLRCAVQRAARDPETGRRPASGRAQQSLHRFLRRAGLLAGRLRPVHGPESRAGAGGSGRLARRAAHP